MMVKTQLMRVTGLISDFRQNVLWSSKQDQVGRVKTTVLLMSHLCYVPLLFLEEPFSLREVSLEHSTGEIWRELWLRSFRHQSGIGCCWWYVCRSAIWLVHMFLEGRLGLRIQGPFPDLTVDPGRETVYQMRTPFKNASSWEKPVILLVIVVWEYVSWKKATVSELILKCDLPFTKWVYMSKIYYLFSHSWCLVLQGLENPSCWQIRNSSSRAFFIYLKIKAYLMSSHFVTSFYTPGRFSKLKLIFKIRAFILYIVHFSSPIHVL